jgi:predicted RNA-binding protein associated with RNAse of E/G family
VTASRDEIMLESRRPTGELHMRWPGSVVAADDTWLAALSAIGTRVTHVTRGIEFTMAEHTLAIFTAAGFYNVMLAYDEAREYRRAYMNVSTPADRSAAVVTWTDLYLDVVVDRDGAPVLLDADEFEEGVRAGLVAPTVAARARGAADRLLEHAGSGAFPFLTDGLDAALARVRARLSG